jgi:hypothetical protein
MRGGDLTKMIKNMGDAKKKRQQKIIFLITNNQDG